MGKSRVNKSVQNWLLLGPTTQPPIPYFCTATICYSLTTVCNVLQSCTYFITITYLLLCHYMCWVGIHPFDGNVIHPIRYTFVVLMTYSNSVLFYVLEYQVSYVLGGWLLCYGKRYVLVPCFGRFGCSQVHPCSSTHFQPSTIYENLHTV